MTSSRPAPRTHASTDLLETVLDALQGLDSLAATLCPAWAAHPAHHAFAAVLGLAALLAPLATRHLPRPYRGRHRPTPARDPGHSAGPDPRN